MERRPKRRVDYTDFFPPEHATPTSSNRVKRATGPPRKLGEWVTNALEYIRWGDLCMLREALKYEPVSELFIAQVFAAPLDKWSALFDMLLQSGCPNVFVNVNEGRTFLPTHILTNYAHLDETVLDDVMSVIVRQTTRANSNSNLLMMPAMHPKTLWNSFMMPCLEKNLVRTVDAMYHNDSWHLVCKMMNVQEFLHDSVNELTVDRRVDVVKELKALKAGLHREITTIQNNLFYCEVVYPLFLMIALRMKALFRLLTYERDSCHLLSKVSDAVVPSCDLFWYCRRKDLSRIAFFEVLETHEVLRLLRRDVWLDELTVDKAHDFIAWNPRMSKACDSFVSTPEYVTALAHAKMTSRDARGRPNRTTSSPTSSGRRYVRC